jgi:hypothetical protein
MNDELGRRLRDAARALDAQSQPMTADEAQQRPLATSPRRVGPLLAGAAAAALVVVGLLTLNAGDDPDTSIEPQNTMPTTDPTTTVTPSPTSPSTTTAPPTTTTISPFAREPIDTAGFPERGIVVTGWDTDFGTETATLYDFDGNVLAQSDVPQVSNPHNVFSIARNQNVLGVAPFIDSLETPPGCSSSVTAPTGRVAICADGREIHRVDWEGNVEILAYAPPRDPAWTTDTSGHWRWAKPSPDGTQVLAQWSGECEAPNGFLLGDPNDPRALGLPSDGFWADAVSSFALGWTDDGQILAQFDHGLCGIGADQPGIYEMTAGAAEGELLIALGSESESGALWQHDFFFSNEIEHAVIDATEWLGYEGCCGEDSHGDGGVTGGVIFEGREIAIEGGPTAQVIENAGPGSISFVEGRAGGAPTDPRIAVFDPDVSILHPDDEPGVTFTCGGYTFRFSHWTLEQPDIRQQVAVAEALIPALGCTLRPSALQTADPGLNELESQVFDALSERYEYGCCGERSEGGAHVAYVVIFEDVTIPIFGSPTAAILETAPADRTTAPLTFLDGTATLIDSSEGTVVLVTCGDYSLTFGWYDDTLPDIDKMVRLGEDILSRMPCVLREPAIG